MDDLSTAVMDVPTSTPSSAPTDSTPSAEPQPTTDRPSFGAALDAFNAEQARQGKRQYGSPALPPAPVAPPAEAAIAPDGTAPTPTPPTSTKRPIPFQVHQTALENARLKTRTEVEQEFRSQYGDPQQLATVLAWAQRASQDRIGFLRDVIAEAAADPTLAPQLASLAGTTLRGSRQDPSPEPQPDFQDERTGNRFYSAKQQEAREAWLRQQLKDEILGKLAPNLSQLEGLQAEREEERRAVQLQRTINGYIAEAKAWPYFAEHKAEIEAALEQAPRTSGHPAEEAWLLRQVYDRIVGPKFSQLEQAKVLATLKSQAHASTLNPSATGAPTGIPKTVRAKDGGTFGAALKWAAEQQTGS